MGTEELIATIAVALVGGISPIIVELIKASVASREKQSKKNGGILVPENWKYHEAPKRQFAPNWLWVIILTIVGGILGYILSSNIKANNRFPTSSSTSTPVTSSQPLILVNTSLNDLANNITSGVGEVVKIAPGTTNQTIVVIEETHDSRLGQVEIAIMLNRLYEDYVLRHIGQEGVFITDGVLDASWFRPSLGSGQVLSSKEEVVIELLAEGEISSGEALTLIYPDFQVHGIEIPVEYNINLSDGASTAYIIYLYEIAATHITADEIAKANELINANSVLEAIEFVINTNEWTSEKYALITDETSIRSVEDWLVLLDDLEAEASRVGANITEQDKTNLQELREFYSKASIRSETMVNEMLRLAATYPEIPLALVMGASHSEQISREFTEASVSFVVVRPESLTREDSSSLSYEAYNRKISGQSVDSIVSLGALLDNRKKPRPVLDQTWLRSKAETYLLTALIADNKSEEHPSFSSQISSQLAQLQYVRLIPDSYRLLNDDKFFAVRVQVENLDKPIEIWVRATTKPSKNTMTLEQALDAVFLSAFVRNILPQTVTGPPKLTQITSNVVAIFSIEEETVEKTPLDKATP